MNNNKPPSEATSEERWTTFLKGIKAGSYSENDWKELIEWAWNEQEDFYEPLLAQRDAEIKKLQEEDTVEMECMLKYKHTLESELSALRSRLENAEKVIEAARPTLVFHYDSTVQIDYQRALEKAMNTYDQPAPIRKEGEKDL